MLKYFNNAQGKVDIQNKVFLRLAYIASSITKLSLEVFTI